MRPDDITRDGHQETFKAGVHLALLSLAAVCSAYNCAAWIARPSKHLAVNAVVYTALLGLECHQVMRHLRREP